MADSKTMEDPVMEAVGFKMNNLKSIRFSRLPGSIQVEVIEELGIDQKIQLFNVNSGFRGYFVRKGIFGRHVDKIVILLVEVSCLKGKNYYLRISIRNGWLDLTFDLLDARPLFRNICSCTRFIIEPWPWTGTRTLTDPSIIEQWKERTIKADTDGKKIAEWFPNLRFVKRLSVRGCSGRFLQGLERLEYFHFKVIELAELHYNYFDLPKCWRWEHLLENQLSICQNVFIENDWWTMREIPGVKMENDPKQRREILDAFKKKFGPQFEEEEQDYLLNEVVMKEADFEINCYRRKIDEDKEMILLVVQEWFKSD